MSEEKPTWKEIRRLIPAEMLSRNATGCGTVRVIAANDNSRNPKQIRVSFKLLTEPALQSAAEVFLHLLDRSSVSNDN